MITTLKGKLVLVAVLLAAFPSLGDAAHATLDPVGGSVSGTSTDPRWIGGYIGCQSGDLTGTIASASQITARLTFPGAAGGVCGDGMFSYTWRCQGTITLTTTSSVTRANASGTYTLDRNFQCQVSSSIGCSYVVRGTQGPFPWTLDHLTQRLTLGGTWNVDIPGLRGCIALTMWSFRATYALSPGVRVL